jgi:hypothetical protein
MLQPLWAVTILAEIVLYALLTQRQHENPWFQRWVGWTVIVQVAAWALNGYGSLYAPFWCISTCGLLVLLCIAAVESALKLRPSSVYVATPLSLGIAVSMLSVNPIQSIQLKSAFFSLILGMFLVYMTPRLDAAPHRAIFAFYLIGKSICYFSAASFPFTIGNGTVFVELIAVVCWIVLELTPSGFGAKI